MAVQMLERGISYEVVTQTVDFGEPNPITKQVERHSPKRRGVIHTLVIEPEEKQWIEHILLALKNVPLKKKEIELCVQHINRLKYEGALRDYYEFYGMDLKELEEKEEAERLSGNVPKADKLRAIIEKNSGRK